MGWLRGLFLWFVVAVTITCTFMTLLFIRFVAALCCSFHLENKNNKIGHKKRNKGRDAFG